MIRHYFDFWDKLVKEWYRKPGMNLYNGVKVTDGLEPVYLPEPWWGWNNSVEKLEAVCINLNPGSGSCCQYKMFLKFLRTETYRQTMPQLRQLLKPSEKWHLTRRAAPIIKSKHPDIQVLDTSNHLSIELCPFHSDYSKPVAKYVDANKDVVKEYVLGFAAEAAKLIDSDFKNKVIVRVSPKTFDSLLKNTGINAHYDNIGNNAAKFRLGEFPDTEFIAVTGVRNHFTNEDLEIIKNL